MKENFAKTVFRIMFSLCAIFFALVLFSCFTPSPLYGTWSDNLGNKITFSDDMSYTAIIATDRIIDEDDNVLNIPTETFSGNFSVAENVLSLSTEYGLVVTEWDIRGSILYLDWTMPQGYGETIKNLRLYHN
ncbi:MAG: hypothetical protein K2I95_05085 [Treponemataceae bacterium]|nr:hypothetical protein [Treponemataceae bacterium]